ncbi:hypothetical protein Pmani_018091 [Petrolisthes manimaculis]|uniref:Uncharacterized protein n=1 Tax=Petrolisthes manimaculis TaxID=1843537 RepID=A0AAE1PN44_9EUCA|nr:hypothetical protein Pmani_018091 [Petrolisthes manimaculis]
MYRDCGGNNESHAAIAPEEEQHNSVLTPLDVVKTADQFMMIETTTINQEQHSLFLPPPRARAGFLPF